MGFSRSSRAQASTEYLVIFALALAIIIPGALLVYNYSKGSNDRLVSEQIDSMGREITYNAEKVYYMGEHSRVSVDVVIPDTIRSAYVLDNSEIVLSFDTQSGVREAVFFSDINITTPVCDGDNVCSITVSPGRAKFRLESKGTYVLLNQTLG